MLIISFIIIFSFTSDELGSISRLSSIPDFQTYMYSESSVLVARLIYSFIVSAGTSSSVFYVYYCCLLEHEKKICTFNMKTFLSSHST